MIDTSPSPYATSSLRPPRLCGDIDLTQPNTNETIARRSEYSPWQQYTCPLPPASNQTRRILVITVSQKVITPPTLNPLVNSTYMYKISYILHAYKYIPRTFAHLVRHLLRTKQPQEIIKKMARGLPQGSPAKFAKASGISCTA